MNDTEKSLEVRASKSPSEMIIEFIKSTGSTNGLKEMLDIQKDYEANEAMKAFNKALVGVHSKVQSIHKTKRNTQTKSNYADLDEIIIKTKPIYTSGGFSVIFSEGEGAPSGHVRVCAELLHELGHSKHFHHDVPLDGKGIQGNTNMTGIHAKASSVSYGRRYLLCMMFNIPTSDDNDGNNAHIDTIDEEQVIVVEEWLRTLADKKKIDKARFLKAFKIEKVEQLPKSRFAEAVTLFKQREAAKD